MNSSCLAYQAFSSVQQCPLLSLVLLNVSSEDNLHYVLFGTNLQWAFIMEDEETSSSHL